MVQQADLRTEPATSRLAGIAPGLAPRVLAVIDNDDHWRPIVDRLLAAAVGSSAAVVLLNVQPKPNEMQTRGLFKEAIRTRLLERGEEMLAHAKHALSEAGIFCKTRVELADNDADAIVRIAHEEDCGSIIVATPPLSALRRTWTRTTGWSSGSTASQLAELADLPVLVVHPGDR